MRDETEARGAVQGPFFQRDHHRSRRVTPKRKLHIGSYMTAGALTIKFLQDSADDLGTSSKQCEREARLTLCTT